MFGTSDFVFLATGGAAERSGASRELGGAGDGQRGRSRRQGVVRGARTGHRDEAYVCGGGGNNAGIRDSGHAAGNDGPESGALLGGTLHRGVEPGADPGDGTVAAVPRGRRFVFGRSFLLYVFIAAAADAGGVGGPRDESGVCASVWKAGVEGRAAADGAPDAAGLFADGYSGHLEPRRGALQ